MKASVGLASLLFIGAQVVSATFHPINLGPHLGKRLVEYQPHETWGVPPRGLQILAGVPFQLEGKIEVTGLGAARDKKFFYPRAEGINVGRKGSRLHVLHGTGYNDPDGTPIAKLLLHFADGRSHAFALIYGVHTRNWYKERSEALSSISDSNSTVAWAGTCENTDSFGATLRLFKTVFDNPFPNVEIKAIDIISLFARSTPVIVALTLEDGPAHTSPASSSFDETSLRREMQVRFVDAAGLSPVIVALEAIEPGRVYFFGQYTNHSPSPLRIDYSPRMVGLNLFVRSLHSLPFQTNLAKAAGASFPQELFLKGSRGVPIGGIVRDRSGRAIPGAHVSLYGIPQPGGVLFADAGGGVTKTDDAGKWSMACLSNVFSGVGFKVTHPSFLSADFFQSEAPADPLSADALRAGRAVFELDRGIEVIGFVTDPAEEPLPSATVTLAPANLSGPNITASTDQRGKFSIIAVESGEAQLLVQANGCAPRLLSLRIEHGMPAREIHLTKGRLVKIRATDQSGAALPGVVAALEPNGGKLLSWTATTDNNGQIAWSNAPTETLRFTLAKDRYATFYGVTIEPGQEESRVTMQPKRRGR